MWQTTSFQQFNSLSHLSLREQVATMARVVVAPTQAFKRLEKRPYWVGVLLVTSLATVLASMLVSPCVLQSAVSRLPTGASDIEVQTFISYARQGQRIGLFLAPVSMLLKWITTALILWAGIRLFQGQASFVKLFSVVGHSNLVLLFSLFLVSAVLLIRGAEAVHSPSDLYVPVGLDVFWRVDQAWLRTLLGEINPFGMWNLILLITGMITVGRALPLWATLTGLVYWMLMLVARLLLAVLTEGMS